MGDSEAGRASLFEFRVSDGVLRMSEERRAVVASLAINCPRCQVPYGRFGCEHAMPTADKLLVEIFRIAAEEQRKQRVKNARHALRYRAESRRGRSASRPLPSEPDSSIRPFIWSHEARVAADSGRPCIFKVADGRPETVRVKDCRTMLGARFGAWWRNV